MGLKGDVTRANLQRSVNVSCFYHKFEQFKVFLVDTSSTNYTNLESITNIPNINHETKPDLFPIVF